MAFVCISEYMGFYGILLKMNIIVELNWYMYLQGAKLDILLFTA